MSKSCKCTLNEDHLKNNKEKGTTVGTHHSRRCHDDSAVSGLFTVETPLEWVVFLQKSA